MKRLLVLALSMALGLTGTACTDSTGPGASLAGTFGLERLDFALDAAGNVAGLHAIAAEAGAAADWQLQQLAPAPGLCGALAWRGPPMRICSFCAEPRILDES